MNITLDEFIVDIAYSIIFTISHLWDFVKK